MTGRGRLNNIAAMLPVFGALMILPPLVNVFAYPAKVFTAPLIVIYLFAVWMALIVLTAMLSQALKPADRGEGHADADPDENGAGRD